MEYQSKPGRPTPTRNTPPAIAVAVAYFNYPDREKPWGLRIADGAKYWQDRHWLCTIRPENGKIVKGQTSFLPIEATMSFGAR